MFVLHCFTLLALASAGSLELTSEVRKSPAEACRRGTNLTVYSTARNDDATAACPRYPLTSQTFDSVIGGDKPVLVKFYAPWYVLSEGVASFARIVAACRT